MDFGEIQTDGVPYDWIPAAKGDSDRGARPTGRIPVANGGHPRFRWISVGNRRLCLS